VILIVFVLLNFGLSAYILGSLTMLTTSSDVDSFDFRQRIHRLESFFDRNNVPEAIKTELRLYMQLHFDTTEHRGDVLSTFPLSVKLPLHRFLYMRTIEVVPVLRGVSKDFRERLISEAEVEFFLAGMSLVHTGDVDTGFFIILDGQAEMFMEGALGEEDEVVLYATRGQAIGKESIVAGMAHPYGIRARTLVRTLHIPVEGYRRACAENPADMATVQRNLLIFCKRHLDMMQGRKSVRTVRQMDHIILTLQSLIKHTSLASATDLCHAVASGDANEVFEMAASGVDVTQADWDGRTALHVAAIMENTHITRMLLRHSANPNAVDHSGCSPTLYACECDPVDNKVLKLLLRAGGTLGAAGGVPQDIVHARVARAIREGRNRVLYRMLEAGVLPSLVDPAGRTLLHVAAFVGNIGACQLLVKCGADVKLRSVSGALPSEETKSSDIAAFLEGAVPGDPSLPVEDLQPFEGVFDDPSLKPPSLGSKQSVGLQPSHRLRMRKRLLATGALLPNTPRSSLTNDEVSRLEEEVHASAVTHVAQSRALEEVERVEDVEGSSMKAAARFIDL